MGFEEGGGPRRAVDLEDAVYGGGFGGVGPARFEDDCEDVLVGVGEVGEVVGFGLVVVKEGRGWEDLAAGGAWVDSSGGSGGGDGGKAEGAGGGGGGGW